MAYQKKVWISWERNRSLANAIGFYLLELNYEKGAARYIRSVFKTVVFLLKNRPETVVAQNPSMVLCILVLLCRSLFRYYLVVDSHNSGIYPLDKKYTILNFISKTIQRKSDLTIVTNKNLSLQVKKNGGNPCILPDKLPDIPVQANPYRLNGTKNLVFICSFHSDEPYMEVLKAAQSINDVTVYITGKYQNKIKNISTPRNVIFTGYLSEINYWSLLLSANVIMDLTTRENCLVCGAYESVSLGKPMVLSDTEAIKSFFTKGCVYAKPDGISIAKCIYELFDNLNYYTEQVKLLKEELELNWKQSLYEFEKCITIPNVHKHIVTAT